MSDLLPNAQLMESESLSALGRITSSQWLETLGRWMFVLPLLLLNLVVIVIPSFSGLLYGFTEWNGYGEATFVGLANFEELLQDGVFIKAFGNNIIYTVLSLVLPISIGLLGAYFLTTIRRGQLFFRVVYFLPHVLAVVVSTQLWRYLLHPNYGVGHALAQYGITFLDFPLLGTRETALYTIAFIDSWGQWGFLLVIYLAAMSGIDTELYEVARLDGASRLQQFRFITLPGIRPTLVFTIMMTIIWSSLVFNHIYILTGGGPANASQVMSTYLYTEAFENFNAGYAASIAVVMSLWVGFAILGFNFLRRRGWDV